MKSADISVFWQELIDAYRDVMVVKSIDSAREYLDLTEQEYEGLVTLSSKLTMARLSYHTTILEAAMADMQRAVNSKRSIAEIALTRMCDLKLSATTEALVARVEALEREISLIKLGGAVPSADDAAKKGETVKKSTEPPVMEKKKEPVLKQEKPERQKALQPYSRWGAVVERVGEIKVPLAAQFLRSEAEREGNRFIIKMTDFFSKKFSSSPADVELVRGVIAEIEKINKSEVTLSVTTLGANVKSPAEELDKLFG